jgi:hypothetical protein
LPDLQMSGLLKFALRLNDAQKAATEYLTSLPDDVHQLLGADRSIVWQVAGGAAELQNIVRRIERTAPPHRRKWSNDCCVLYSYAVEMVCRAEIGHTMISIGRNFPANRIVCAMFSRERDRTAFSIADFTMSHLAIGFALDSVAPRVGLRSIAIEVKNQEQRRLQGGDASLLSDRIDEFLSGSG